MIQHAQFKFKSIEMIYPKLIIFRDIPSRFFMRSTMLSTDSEICNESIPHIENKNIMSGGKKI